MNKRLFVAGLPFTTTQDELKNLFADAGTVVSAAVIQDRMTGKSKGFGFVEMETIEEATKAVSTLNDSEFGGRKLIVAEAKPMEDRSEGRRNFGDRPHGGFRSERPSFGKRREGGRGKFGRGERNGGHAGFRGGRT
ncbi:MAG: RNP-1 like protein RNA-binding protein [Candidatus Woesebacteria bacterium GW2011_GWA1_41_7]|uniref:RNP-1 like protein RNA-binding protein n=1 Tax=Candidatus Woesebacteria bacterium GW2011_GWA1_41_7 TaxID=1618556 RepID=A0A0G0WVH4_9BACT|nr:MAG: RNP-1 like protein RNA-binding protein [Candidatus Woesebacteria bacterium GW2011_GWA1_41_7]